MNDHYFWTLVIVSGFAGIGLATVSVWIGTLIGKFSKH